MGCYSMSVKMDQIRIQEIDESIERGVIFTILSGEEARYSIDRVVGFIEEKNILGSFLSRSDKERIHEAKTELLKIFRRQLRKSKVYPRTSRDNIIAFIGGYIAACSGAKLIGDQA